ncbi:MAG: glutamate-1-semialdehyde 2,1-aminomutase [Candidatus Omnitrophota bacterium]
MGKVKNESRNSSLFKQAEKHLVGGVNSPVRSFNYVGGTPLVMKGGEGSRIYDHDGKTYIDYVLSYGALMLGHAYPDVMKAIKRSLKLGTNLGTTTSSEIELAELIKKAIPQIKKLRFTNSGTEAIMGAVRLARGFTGRDKLVKFENAYHGHADYLLVKGGSGLASMRTPSSKGVPADFVKHTLIAEYNEDSIDRLFKKHGSKIAAVLVEPVGGNYGVVAPDKSLLKYLRKRTREYGAMLVFDEVITGFRFDFGAAAKNFGIKPDLICLGKIIGGGLPIGAYGGRGDVMGHLAPLGGVYQASTFAGNPIVMQAGISTLKALSLSRGRYPSLRKMTEDLVFAAREFAKLYNVKLEVSCYGTMFSVKFKQQRLFRKFYRKLLSEGVYLAPSEFEANFVSFAHTTDDIRRTKIALEKAFQDVTK